MQIKYPDISFSMFMCLRLNDPLHINTVEVTHFLMDLLIIDIVYCYLYSYSTCKFDIRI